MKVAIVHDYLVNRGGAERVVAAMHRVWPDAPIFTSIYHPDATYDEFRDADVRTSGLQRLSKDPAKFRRLLPLFPRAFKRLDLSGYDVIVSSSSGFAHHVRVPAGACHVVYSYSPPRFLWDSSYALDGIAPRWARPALPALRARMRRKDLRSAGRPHFYLAVSGVAQKRLKKVYGRPSTVLHPPVDLERFAPSRFREDFYLLVGRLLPYRRPELAVEAFTQLGTPLVVVGDGPSRAALEAAAGPNVRFAGVVSDQELDALYERCRGVVVPGVEDFGLIPLEANACGKPAIAYGDGGAVTTVVDGTTGVLFRRQSAGSLARAVARAERLHFDPATLRAHAESFSEEAFAASLSEFVEGATGSCLSCARHRRVFPSPVPSVAPLVKERAAEEA